MNKKKTKLSNCCCSPIVFETDCICSNCFEGCEFFYEEDVDKSKKKINGGKKKDTN